MEQRKEQIKFQTPSEDKAHSADKSAALAPAAPSTSDSGTGDSSPLGTESNSMNNDPTIVHAPAALAEGIVHQILLDQNAKQAETNQNTSDQQDDYEKHMGVDPAKAKEELTISPEMARRIQSWLKSGISPEDKKYKLKILETIPRTGGDLNLEPPALDPEFYTPKLVTEDNFLKDYANLASGALAANAQIFDFMTRLDFAGLDGGMVKRNLAASIKLLSHLMYELTFARRHKIINAHGTNPIIQSLLKKTEPSNLLFDGKLNSICESKKNLEKTQRELSYKPKKNFGLDRSTSSLNWGSSASRRESGWSSKSRRHAPARHFNNNNNRGRSFPQKRSYHQTQPHQGQRF